MSINKKEKEIVKTLAKTFSILPDHKKEFLLGYAEGVAAMASTQGATNDKATGSNPVVPTKLNILN